jgi:hypothetical protein
MSDIRYIGESMRHERRGSPWLQRQVEAARQLFRKGQPMSDETRVDVLSISPKLVSYIATRDKRIAKTRAWSPTPLMDAFHELITRGVVRVGGRASCGGAVDPTWVIFTSWNEVVRKARQLGYQITEANIKQRNAWATRGGGFWDENEYSIATTEESSGVRSGNPALSTVRSTL